MTMYYYMFMYGHFPTVVPPVCSHFVLHYVLCSQSAIHMRFNVYNYSILYNNTILVLSNKNHAYSTLYHSSQLHDHVM